MVDAGFRHGSGSSATTGVRSAHRILELRQGLLA
jgi:hypothetical protein